MPHDLFPKSGAAHGDPDPQETADWLDSLSAVLRHQGPGRAHYLLETLAAAARRAGVHLPYRPATPYVNTLTPADEARSPGDAAIEARLRALVRWNAMAMVVKANRRFPGLGGHLSSFASAATLYEVAFNHFFKGPDHPDGADLVYFQGHCAPGIYARALLEGRLSTEQLDRFRREAGGPGLSAYPHPWLMPGFWQFPTVSMGLGPMTAIYRARFMRYLQHRGLIPASRARVWAFLGDGEMDEPESLGAISLAAREKLDNLTFVVNCNLQRLDGPVRGNGKIIQELEGVFRGAGWEVFKVVWGRDWDPLLAQDGDGALLRRMEEAVDGDYQNYVVRDGGFTRAHFFGRDPGTAAMVHNLSDEEIKRLRRGGHDPQKVYAAYHAALQVEGRPTVVLAKTVKGYGMGAAGEGQNPTHQLKKLGRDDLIRFRDRYRIPVPDADIEQAPYYLPPEDSPELTYLRARRAELGGPVPSRHEPELPLPVPPLSALSPLLSDSGSRELSTTMAFVRLLSLLMRQQALSPHLVPIVPDEARTFGMEGLFRKLGIYAAEGQLYEPVDHDQVMYYREDRQGQILQEGINEAGALSSFIAAGTALSSHGVPMVPFYAFYSMFGFQRVMDLIWAAADSRARGFLIGATSGRTTLAGEGLQHLDGHSQVLAAAVPNCVSYDPTYAYELAVIVQDGLRRMYIDRQDVFFYVTVMNENYAMPAMPEGVEEGILRGMYLLSEGADDDAAPRVQLLGSGAILREVRAAAALLRQDFGVEADVWSVTSFNELYRAGQAAARHARLHPEAPAQPGHVENCLRGRRGPAVAATDYMGLYAEQIRAFVGRPYHVLGTDGFGRSDTRDALRRFFEVDRHHVVVAALRALCEEGAVAAARVTEAIQRYGIDPDAPHPRSV